MNHKLICDIFLISMTVVFIGQLIGIVVYDLIQDKKEGKKL